jgi:hypothetical protein
VLLGGPSLRTEVEGAEYPGPTSRNFPPGRRQFFGVEVTPRFIDHLTG